MKGIYSNKLFLAAFSIFSLLILMANSSGRGFVFGQAVTGAPGDSNNTCASAGCHSSGAFSPNPILKVADGEGNMVSSFIPGQTYDITLEIQSAGSPDVYGFQMVALTADNSPVNNWEELGDNVRLVTINEKEYIEHNSPKQTNEFTAKWTAPEEGTGDVTFYFAANAANGNGSPSGDGATNSNFVFSELTTASKDLSDKSISVFPQPAMDYLTITGERLDYKYVIYNTQGLKIIAGNFTNETILDIANLNSGLFFIRIQSGEKSITKKIIKN